MLDTQSVNVLSVTSRPNNRPNLNTSDTRVSSSYTVLSQTSFPSLNLSLLVLSIYLCSFHPVYSFFFLPVPWFLSPPHTRKLGRMPLAALCHVHSLSPHFHMCNSVLPPSMCYRCVNRQCIVCHHQLAKSFKNPVQKRHFYEKILITMCSALLFSLVKTSHACNFIIHQER